MRFLAAIGSICLSCLPLQSLQAEVTQILISLPGADKSYSGRLFVAFTREESEESDDEEISEPRLTIGDEAAPRNASPFFAVDIVDWDGAAYEFVPTAGFPLNSLSLLEEGSWQVQALFDVNETLSDLDSPGNFYSLSQLTQIDATPQSLSFSLTEVVPQESLPDDTELLKFVRIRSDLLSRFYGKDIYLRASVLLPTQYIEGSGERYPVLYHVAGLNGRFTRSQRLLEDEEFVDYWIDEETPPAVIVFLDGESPFGDSYQMNSAVSGPYADANFTELFPHLAVRFPIDDVPSNRFVTGCSTGGWVSMALQILYPDYFNGAYSLSPDSPSFRAYQLVNIYEDDNAYYSANGMIRPSAREINGDPRFSIADEISMEAAIGPGNSYVVSGKQWGAWNAVYGQPDEVGNPIPVWDQTSGEINPLVADSWRAWDLDYYVRDQWANIGNELSGKLQFWMGDMDNYYLTNGLRFFEETLNLLEAPAADAKFNWIPYHGHCRFGTQVHYIDVLNDMAERASR
ncbi:MAG: alpha/beta hydrolase-fold protein [Gammaproteobacteria bacterium]|nr:alpha/beta hydrolase-fold protein [Gammaproteobacteria bacterium]MDD9894724.1 alpha/beta hydrolase-fold protein [Gammaproteobacteria bacterium]MDD9957398.1 alpha/beta hydrolase-fold protein [Gammaproteobacteria bacterium]